MAEVALQFLLEKVKNLMSDQYHLIRGAEKELKLLNSDLKQMEAFLEDSNNNRVKGKQFRLLEMMLRDAVYKAEDTLDSCILENQKWNKNNNIFRYINPKQYSLASEVKSLRETVIQPILSGAMTNFAPLLIADEWDTTKTHDDENGKIPLMKEVNIVGFDEVSETVINYLKQDSGELEVISIIGMAGQGKTTLAWNIYHNQKIQNEFPTHIWVHVSQEFNRRNVYLKILEHFNKRDMFAGKEDQDLVKEVRSHLKNKKFILFLDDVWTAKNWGEIEDALPMDNKSGKVLITSCDKKVAVKANAHQLQFLTDEESWQLLQLVIFRKKDSCPLELVELGKYIAKKCGGLPLAIVVIGGILFNKISTVGVIRVTRLEWEKVSNSVSSYFIKDNIETKNTFITLSYDKLPNTLKDCFLYMGMFEEDTEILAWKLFRLWIAEGFIPQHPHKSLEEVAEDNLRDLMNRNLVMVGKTNAEGQVKTCRVHGMIRGFCKEKAAFSEQNMFQEVKKTKEGIFYPDIPDIHLCRRLCIHSDVVEFLQQKPKGPRTRSFLCFSKEVLPLPLEYSTSIFDAFKLLRVLEVNPIKFTDFPIKLSQLNHLKYISLSGDNFKSIPEDFSSLTNLQTIRIDTTERTLEVKGDIWNMKELRHFKTKAAISLKQGTIGKASKGEGKNLRTISRLSVQSCTEDVFSRASLLNTLGIRGDLSSLLLESTCLNKLERLQKLKLLYDISPVSASEKPMRDLPTLDWFPPNLRILTLSSTFLEWKHMQTLGKLEKLEVLKLKENAFMGKFWNADGGGFRLLELLHMGRTDLESWTASGDNPFPRLNCLVLKNCENLEEIPLVLWESLEVLDIECAKKIEEQAKQRMEGEKQNAQMVRGFKLIISTPSA